MSKGRIEAFSDGVFAIILTIMVLELKVPHGSGLDALGPLLPVFCAYVLSFLFVAIYWNNHHHLLHAARTVTVGLLWSNLHLLFWLSLIPFVTGWAGETWAEPSAAWPVALYGFVLAMCGFGAFLMVRVVNAQHLPGSPMAVAIDSNRVKSLVSTGLFVAGIGLSFVDTRISALLYFVVSLAWLIPDRRIEDALEVAAPAAAE